MSLGYWPIGGIMWFWIFLIFGCGSWVFGYRPWRYRRNRSYDSYRQTRHDNPYDIASARLARGEISYAEFEKIKKAILDSEVRKQ
jgi:uncharacterized membrane protein